MSTNRTIGVAGFGARKKLNDGFANYGVAVSKQLSIVPKGFPLAPEDDEFSEEIRQMVVGRYRVLFTIRRGKVHVLHVRGAHNVR
jgi:hypothetical protein